MTEFPIERRGLLKLGAGGIAGSTVMSRARGEAIQTSAGEGTFLISYPTDREVAQGESTKFNFSVEQIAEAPDGDVVTIIGGGVGFRYGWGRACEEENDEYECTDWDEYTINEVVTGDGIGWFEESPTTGSWNWSTPENLQQGDSRGFSVSIQIDEDATPGTHEISLFEQEYPSGPTILPELSPDEERFVSVTVLGPELDLTAQTSTESVQPGETFQIFPVVTNTGNASQSVSVDLFRPSAEFGIETHTDDGGEWISKNTITGPDVYGWRWDEDTDSGPLSPDGTREPSVEIAVADDVAPGEYTFDMGAFTGVTEKTAEATATIEVSGTVDAEITLLSFDQEVYSPGEDLTTQLRVENTGGTDSEFVILSVLFPPEGSSLRVKTITQLDQGENKTVSLDDELPADIAKGVYDASVFVYGPGSIGESLTPEVPPALDGDTRQEAFEVLSSPELDLLHPRLVQQAEHTRDRMFDTLGKEQLEASDAVPEWAEDPPLVVGQPTIPVFDLQIPGDSGDTASPEIDAVEVVIKRDTNADDRSVVLGSEDPDGDSITEILGDDTSLLDQMTSQPIGNGAEDNNWPVFSLSADLSKVTIELTPRDSETVLTEAEVPVNPVETSGLKIAMVRLHDPDGSTQYGSIGQGEYNEKAARHAEFLNWFLPATDVTVDIYDWSVQLQNRTLLDELLRNYRDRQSGRAYAAVDGDQYDGVVAFVPPGLAVDEDGDPVNGVRPGESCDRAVLINQANGFGDKYTTAHELTHYFLDSFAESEYRDDQETFHADPKVISTCFDYGYNRSPTDDLSVQDLPLSNIVSATDSYMQSSSGEGMDTYALSRLVESEFSCAEAADGETAERALSVTAQRQATGIEVRSLQAAPNSVLSSAEEGADVTIRDAAGDAIETATLPIGRSPPIFADDETGSGESGPDIITGKVPYPPATATIELSAPASEDSGQTVSTEVSPVGLTLRETLAGLPGGIFVSSVDPADARRKYLDRLASGKDAIEAANYEEARTQFETLQREIQADLRENYDPPAGIPSQQELLNKIDDRLTQIERIQEDAERSTITDYANDQDVVDVDGLLDALDDWRGGEIGVDLLLDVLDAWRSGDPVT